MAAGSRHGRGADQLNVRVPDGLRDRLKGAADLNGRSLNAEIVKRLEASLRCIPVDENAEKDGPAEVAASPSHGSNNPRKGNAVNRQHDTIAPRDGATASSLDIDECLYQAKMLAQVNGILSTNLIGENEPGRSGMVEITLYEAEALSYLADAVEEAASRASSAFYKGSKGNANLRGSGKADPLLALVRDYEAGLAAFNASPDTLTDAELDRIRDVTWKPPRSVLTSDAVPSPTTMEGVVAAVRCLVREHEECGSDGKLDRAVLPAILAFLDPPPVLAVPDASQRAA